MGSSVDIPKCIHYCWFGEKPLPKLAKRCIASWKKYCPDYEIIEWNEKNFDVNAVLYTQQAYYAKKYAFVSDYARFWILEKYGGIYMDTDVELISSMDDILQRGAYIGCEQDADEGITLNPGLGIAAEPHNKMIKELLAGYQERKFIHSDGNLNLITIVQYTTETFKKYGLQELAGIQMVGDFTIYPREYFSPQHYRTGKLEITPKTHSIHYYSASWYTHYEKFADKMSHILGEKWTKRIVRWKKAVKRRMGK